MSISTVGIQAYSKALQNFGQTEATLKESTMGSSANSQTFANVLDQSLLRDSVDRGENFGAHADFIKQQVATTLPTANPNSFTDTVSNSLNKLHSLQKEKAHAIDDFASGRNQNVHELMITLQKASVAMSLTSAVRGKVMEAYKELSRIQF